MAEIALLGAIQVVRGPRERSAGSCAAISDNRMDAAGAAKAGAP
jgi:hypothetical protein